MRINFSQTSGRARKPHLAGALALAILATAAVPSAAYAEDEDKAEEASKPVTDQSVNAVDVAATPIEDLNLRKDEIPPLLLAAQADPYQLAGISRCSHYTAAISELDAVLGPDFDVADAAERQTTVGSVAKQVVGSFIPFRGLIRELSGANKHEREFQDAVVAGVMRRSFLKGAGLKAGCKYPARPADDATRARIAAQIEMARIAEENEKKNKDKDKD